MNKGLVQIFPLLIIFLITFLGYYFYKHPEAFSSLANRSSLFITTTPAPTESPISSPTITSTPTLLSTQGPTPKVTIVPTKAPVATSRPVTGPPGAGYSSITVQTQLGNFSARVLSIDLSSARVITDTANDSDCATDCPVLTLADFVSRNGGFAGVNGTYFCPSTYPECASKSNSFDFPVYNTRASKWINQGNLFWDGRAMVYFDGSGGHYKQNAKDFGGGLTAGIVNYPGLVSGGNVQIDDSQSGLSDKQRAVGTKVGIGLRGSMNVMVVIASSVNMQQFAHVFKSLGADSALNLDTGGSTALYYNGKYLAGPGRNIPNVIIFAR